MYTYTYLYIYIYIYIYIYNTHIHTYLYAHTRAAGREARAAHLGRGHTYFLDNITVHILFL